MGYKASDLFQTNYILWVEGASDKIYFNYWLKKMDPTLKEGQHYSIMFYGGPNFKHFLYYKDKEFDLTFLKTLNQNFGIYIDSDRKNQSEPIHEKKQAIEQSFTQNGLFCWLTEYREIENYIPFETFEKAVKKVNKKLNININADNYGDRGTVEDKDAQLSYSSKIQIPQSIFSKIQKNKDGTLKGVSDEDLRNEIEKAIQSTKSNTFGISKTTVAEEVVQNQPEIIGDELMNKLNDLIIRIKKANNKT